jgi:hypothetical protein
MDDHWKNSTPHFQSQDNLPGTTAGDQAKPSDSYNSTTIPDSNRLVHGNGDDRNNSKRNLRRGGYRELVAPLETMTPEAAADFWREIRNNDNNGDVNEDTGESTDTQVTGNTT